MSTWNHRIVRFKEEQYEWLEICECFYEADGSLSAHTAKGVSVVGEDMDEIRRVLEQMIACTHKPIVDAMGYAGEDTARLQEVDDAFEEAFANVFGSEDEAISTLEQENRQLRARNERLEKFAAQIEHLIDTSKN